MESRNIIKFFNTKYGVGATACTKSELQQDFKILTTNYIPLIRVSDLKDRREEAEKSPYAFVLKNQRQIKKYFGLNKF